MSKRSKRPPTDTLDGARQAALRLLARREHSAGELRNKLKLRGVPEPLTEQVIEDFAARDWQSDRRYAESVLRNRVSRGYGPLRVRVQLSAAGVDESLIEETLSDAGCDWQLLARRAYAKRFGEPPQDAAEWQKRYRFLAQRGFTAEQVHAVLRETPE